MSYFKLLPRASVLLLAADLAGMAPEAAAGPKKRDKKARKAAEILAQNDVPKGAWEAYFREGEGRTYTLIQPAVDAVLGEQDLGNSGRVSH